MKYNKMKDAESSLQPVCFYYLSNHQVSLLCNFFQIATESNNQETPRHFGWCNHEDGSSLWEIVCYHSVEVTDWMWNIWKKKCYSKSTDVGKWHIWIRISLKTYRNFIEKLINSLMSNLDTENIYTWHIIC